jgi:hypothetical protein
MELDEETTRKIELFREWKKGFDTGTESSDTRNNFIIEDLIRKINQLEAQLSEFKNADGEYIQ